MKVMIALVLGYVLFLQTGPGEMFSGISERTYTMVPQDSLMNITLGDVHTANTSEDGKLDFEGLAMKYVKPAEKYDIVTEDGYILTIFRIRGNGNVVLLSHGILCTSDDFILRGKTSLINLLAELDYDIWVMNYRGNRYSRKHLTLNPDVNPGFWQYSLEEYGNLDLAATIDFVLAVTGEKQLSIVGHSEGSAAGLVLTATRPEYNKKIKVFIAMAPGAYVTNSGKGLRTLTDFGPVIANFLSLFGIQEIFGYNTLSQIFFASVCSRGSIGYELCINKIIGSLSGYEYGNIEPEFFDTILGHFPAGTSRKNLDHYVQLSQSNRFEKFDYGEGNYMYYGTEKPPLYNLRNVKCKVALISAENDQVVSVQDTERLRNELPNMTGYYKVGDSKFTHVDYLWGRNAYKVCYNLIIDTLKEND